MDTARTVTAALAAALLLTACTGEVVVLGEDEAEAEAVPGIVEAVPVPAEPAPDDEAFDEVPADDTLLASFQEAMPSPADPPPTVIVATMDGRLEVWDTATSRVLRVLDEYDSAAEDEANNPDECCFGLYLDTLALEPSGDRLAIAICCEPAVGHIQGYAFPDTRLSDGHPIQQFGTHPAFGWDGRMVVAIGTSGPELMIASGPGGGVALEDDPALLSGDIDAEFNLWQPTFSPLLHELAVVEVLSWDQTPGVFAPAETRIAVVDGLRAQPYADAVRTRFRAPDGLQWTAPAYRRDGKLVVVEQPVPGGDPFALQERGVADGVVAQGVVLDPVTGERLAEFPLPHRVLYQRYDASHTFLLSVGPDGQLTWQGRGRTGTIADANVLDAVW